MCHKFHLGSFVEMLNNECRNAKPPRLPRRDQAASSGSISTESFDDLPSAFDSSRMSSWIDVRQGGSRDLSMDGSGQIEEALHEGWQHTEEACNHSDHSDFDRFDILPDDRSEFTLSLRRSPFL